MDRREERPRHGGQITGTTAVDDFLTHLEKERDVSPNTLIAYRRDLEEFVEFLGRYYGAEEWSWQGLDRLAIRGFLGYLTKKKL
ncbi:MAG TPA: site-specific integrase, partial [Gemmatimonadaceae bacterium]|nr:site-specific integrase [Gemmatimonadaceae bacterium]